MENSELINTKTTFSVQTHGITTLNPVLLLLLLLNHNQKVESIIETAVTVMSSFITLSSQNDRSFLEKEMIKRR